MNDAPPNLPDPERLKKSFEQWWGTIASIFGTLASALGALNIVPAPWARAIALLVTMVGLSIAVLLYRKQVRKQAERTRLEEAVKSPEQRPSGAAFRGLRRFQRGEKLPGEDRRRKAATLLGQVQHPNFELVIVTGDSGAGKSSLLECALSEPLEKSGYLVEFINLSSQLPVDSTGHAVEPAQISSIWEGIRAKILRRLGDSNKSIVLILDQFEELLSRLRVATAREALGDDLRKAISDGWRIVIGLRREYLADLKDVAARLGRPVSLQDTFIVRNFDLTEAKEVIRECALRDEIALDDNLPDLIVEDLAVDSSIRPPDLQIVCEALHGELTADRYRREGRAAGLRSRFIKDTIDLTGDSVLARSILRELCDLPNNKKRSEPVGAMFLAEKGRSGAPGSRATPDAVEAVLESLSKSYVIVRTKDDDDIRWSLIHDYMVEPIKIATEEQATLSEAAAAELEYFLAEAASGRTKIIPLVRLAKIRRHSPPALLDQISARKLIRRSMLIGYGKPTALISFVALVSVTSVIVAATQWNVWRSYGVPLSHWENSGRRAGWLIARLLDDPINRLVLGDIRDRSSRLTVWDLQTGDRLAAYTGTIFLVNNRFWSYDANSGKITLWQSPGKERWSRLTSSQNRPKAILNLIDSLGDPPNGKLIFQTDFPLENPWIAVLNLADGNWTIWHNSDVEPLGEEGSGGYVDRDASSALRAHLEGKLKRSRLTVWPLDYSNAVFDKHFDTVVSLLGFVEADGLHYLSFVVEGSGGVETIAIRVSQEVGGKLMKNFEVAYHSVTPLPSELRWSSHYNYVPPDLEDEPRQWALALGRQVLLVDRQKTRTIVWPFDPIAGRFGQPFVSLSPAPGPSRRQDGTMLLLIPARPSGAMMWHTGNSGPIWLPTLDVELNDRIEYTSDFSRVLVVHNDNTAQLWSVDEGRKIASHLLTIKIPHLSQVDFSSDERMVVARQEGGIEYGWTLQGESLGILGSVGSEIRWITYDPNCERILVWTQEGQRLDWRRGTDFPLYGFQPARKCLANHVQE